MDVQNFVKEKIKWLGHATFRIEGSKATVYIDPWKLQNPIPADVICITHSHFDHLSEEDVNAIKKPSTVIIGPPDCKAGFGAAFKTIAPGRTISANEVTVEAVPAYNMDKEFHPQKNKWVGYIVTIDGVRVYHSGDSDMIPEMESLNVDVALLPVGGTYTMTADQAAEAAGKIGAKVTVPMHCGDIVGTSDDIRAFAKLAKIDVVVLEPTK
jgi:L-ascorbate metabolism protein UlaG (beta-lactamase superfamily)